MMNQNGQYFFCGVGGSGMLPLALILKARGASVSGSDRALDQGRSEEKFAYLRNQGINLFPQDGSGLNDSTQTLVASAAIEDSVPDVAAALANGSSRVTRAELLADIFNAADNPIGVAGTSGKSTTTGMIGWILHDIGRRPTIMNGAVMKNFVSKEALFASALVGDGPDFVSEVDESDGSIANFSPKIAVLNNIKLDHKSMDELRQLFGDFIGKAEIAIINLDDAETTRLALTHTTPQITYGLKDKSGTLWAENILPEAFSISFTACAKNGERAEVKLKMPGLHNVSNALAAIGATIACGLSLIDSAHALSRYEGVKRRFELVGQASSITIIDDFGHNPDKIAATLRTLHDFPGRILVMFQPHGFGPLRKMKSEFIACFSDNLNEDDILLIPEPVYFGGTVDRSVSSNQITDGVVKNGRKAETHATREECGERLIALSKAGDRIIVMGARDDTLSDFAKNLVDQLKT